MSAEAHEIANAAPRVPSATAVIDAPLQEFHPPKLVPPLSAHRQYELLTNFPVFRRFFGIKRPFFDGVFQTTEALRTTEFTEKIFYSKLSFLSGSQCFSVKKCAPDRWHRNSDCSACSLLRER
jgi:hypothetical protein